MFTCFINYRVIIFGHSEISTCHKKRYTLEPDILLVTYSPSAVAPGQPVDTIDCFAFKDKRLLKKLESKKLNISTSVLASCLCANSKSSVTLGFLSRRCGAIRFTGTINKSIMSCVLSRAHYRLTTRPVI